jgi:5'-methylthioadenosine phosphorylase
MSDLVVGIIGGTGLGQHLGALGSGERVEVETPFGKPSAPITLTEAQGVKIALLPRHGEGHVVNPSQLNYRANVFALKKLGVTHVLASGAVGSLREEIAPRHLVIPDQVIDKTFRRQNTFFDDFAAHVEFAAPFCPTLRALLIEEGSQLGATVHPRALYVCMEGPQFSTRAESELHRSWGAQLIGMTVMPEAKLCREAELCYALVALPTDYDCWRPHPEGLSQQKLLEEIIGNLKAATETGLSLLKRALPRVKEAAAKACPCQSALAMSIFTDKAKISAEVKRKLSPITGKYLGS